MPHRHSPLPRRWLMTDARLPDLFAAIARLPRGSGIVFRPRAMAGQGDRATFERVMRSARGRHIVLLADTPTRAHAWHADGAHHRSRLRSIGLRSFAVHDAREAALARRMRADLIFVSPVFATRSHPGARPIGPARAGLIAGRMRQKTLALGGMDARRARRTAALGFHGWAAIDALA